MGSIILFDSVKGGVGKSTLLAQFSVAMSSKYNIAIMDCDPQGSLVTWATRRFENNNYSKNFDLLAANLDLQQYKNEYDFILIDSAGADTTTGRQLLLQANIVISPLQPTQAALDTIILHYDILRQAISVNKNIKAFYLLNDCSTHFKDQEAIDAKNELNNFINLNNHLATVIPSLIYSRKLLKTTYSTGGTCFDIVNNKSLNEIQNAISFVLSEYKNG